MKILKVVIATIALSAAMVTSAHARDSFHIGINIGGHGHHQTHRSYHHAPVYCGGHYSHRTVRYTPVRYHHYRGHRYNARYGYHRSGHNYRHQKRHQRRHSRRHHSWH